MKFVSIVPTSGGNVQAVVNGQIRATGATAAAVMRVVAKSLPPNTTLAAPKAMAQNMKAGDIVTRNDINSVAAPAYNSRKQ